MTARTSPATDTLLARLYRALKSMPCKCPLEWKHAVKEGAPPLPLCPRCALTAEYEVLFGAPADG